MKTLEEFDLKKREIVAREANLAKGIETIVADEKENRIFVEKEKIDTLLKYVGEIYEKKLNLETDRFYIAITGAMNSGKSTLLNALLFKKDVLSVDPTACTAKIAFIKKSDKKEITVKYYTREEWEKWKKDTKQSNSIEEIDFNRYVENGEKHKDKFGKTETVSESDLAKYTATQGELMPLVNTITIKDPEVSLVGAQIVDTPGTGDPVTFRSKVAEDYIGKADAIIYVMYTSECLTKTDIDTLKDIIIASGKNADNIILVINKKDSAEGGYYKGKLYETFPKFEEYLEHELGDLLDKDLKGLGLNKCPHVFVCGTAARIAQEKMAGKELDKDLKEREQILDDFIDIEDPEEILDYSGLNEFREQVEGYLIKNKEETVLGQHSRFTDEQKNRVLNIFKQEKERFAKGLEARNDISKLEESIKKKTDECNMIEKRRKDFERSSSDNREARFYKEKVKAENLEGFYREIEKSLSFDEYQKCSRIENFRDKTRNDICNAQQKSADSKQFESYAVNSLKDFEIKTTELVNDILREMRRKSGEVVASETEKLKKGLRVKFDEKLKKWNENVAEMLDGTEYSTEYVVFPESEIEPLIEKTIKDIKKDINSKINEQKMSIEFVSVKIHSIQEETRGIFGKWHSTAKREMTQELLKYLNETAEEIKNYLKEFRSKNIEDEILPDVKRYIKEQLPDNLWKITKDIFDEELSEVMKRVGEKSEQSLKDLQDIENELKLKTDEFNKKKAELNNKIQIVEGYIGRIETI